MNHPDGCPLAVGSPASSAVHFRDVTGGVYKARERIHRGVLIRDSSDSSFMSRVADSIRTEAGFFRLAPLRRFATVCTDHCSTCSP